MLRGQGTTLALVMCGELLGWVLPYAERHLPTSGLGFDASTAQATLASVTGMITLAGFIVTAITLVIQTVQTMSRRLVATLGHFSRYLVLFGLLIGTDRGPPPLADRTDALQRLTAHHLADPLLNRLANQPDPHGLGGPSPPRAPHRP